MTMPDPPWMKVGLVWLVALAILVLSGCGGPSAGWCASDKARIEARAAALDQCAQTRGCVVTSDSVVALYDGVYEHLKACPVAGR